MAPAKGLTSTNVRIQRRCNFKNPNEMETMSNLARQYMNLTSCRYFRHSTNPIFSRASPFHDLNPQSQTDMLVLCPKFDTLQVLAELPKLDVVSITALMGQLAKQNQNRESIFLFQKMLHLNIRPTEYTFGTVVHSAVVLEDVHLGKQIHAFSEKIGLNSHVFVGSAILDIYTKLSDFEDVLKVFEDIHNPNVVSYSTLIRAYIKEGRFNEATEIFRSMPERNVVSWNTMISGCSQTGKNEEAVDFFVEMLREGFRPSQFSYPCVIIAAANIGAIDMGKSIHACAVKFLGDLSLHLTNSLISFYAKCGSMEDSLLAFKKMHERNIVSWNAVICGYAQNGRGIDAIKMYENMKLSGVRPNSVSLLGLLLACNHVGLIDEAFKFFNESKDEDPNLLKAEHYACMIDLLSRNGRFREAEIFIRDLPFDPGIGFWKALLGGCQVHSELELGEVAAMKILELDPSDVSSYLMLSNAHSAAGRWGDVLTVRKKLREKGLSRIPGSSWIEIQSKVHVFVTGDKRHDHKDEIYKMLRILLDNIMQSQDILLGTDGELTKFQTLDSCIGID